MIVRLARPRGAAAGGPWLLYDEAEVLADVIEPTPALEAMMPEACAWFEAERLGSGWEILRRLDAGSA